MSRPNSWISGWILTGSAVFLPQCKAKGERAKHYLKLTVNLIPIGVLEQLPTRNSEELG